MLDVTPAKARQDVEVRLGSVLRGKYRLDAVLGEGGMAVVYAATHRNSKRFAVKVLHPDLSRRPDVRQRFLREGYVANSVGHAGAVTVLDDDVTEGGDAFLVMELLEGVSIDVLLARLTRLPIAEALAITDQLLDVLSAAHARNIVHRDVKPANLFLDHDGMVKVLDFGIARIAERSLDEGDGTMTGFVLGTPAFMAPEQALGRSTEIDARTDVWSTGALLFALLSGHIVHEGRGSAELVVKAGSLPARSLATVAPQVPAEIVAIVDRALAFTREERWSSAAEMQAALVEAQRKLGIRVDRSELRAMAESVSLGRIGAVDALGPTAVSDRNMADNAGASQTTTAKPLTSPRETERPRRLAPGVVSWLGAIVVAGVAVTFGWRASHVAVASAAAPEAAIDAGRAGSITLTDLPAPPTSSATAAAAYRAAMQAYRDGALDRALALMLEAGKDDPSMTAAHLRYAVWSGIGGGLQTDETRGAFGRARDLRSSLDARDIAILRAYEPLFATPPDADETGRRLASLAAEHSNDAELVYYNAVNVTGSWYESYDSPAWERVLALDPSFGMVWNSKAAAAMIVGDAARADVAIGRCLAVDHGSDSCVYYKMNVHASTGRCDAALDDARTMVASEPSGLSYALLARALLGDGASRETVAETVQQSMTRDAPGPAADMYRTQASLRMAMAEGRFADVEIAARTILRSTKDFHARGVATIALIDAADEQGRPSEALAIAEDFWHRRGLRPHLEAIDQRDTHSPLPYVAGRLVAGNRLTLAELTEARASWLRDLRSPELSNAEEVVWLYGVADSSATPALAKEALTQLGHAPTLGVYAEIGIAPHILGRVLFLAGRLEDARRYLDAAAHECFAWFRSVDEVRSTELLGEVAEAQGDRDAACSAYATVAKRWGDARPGSVTAAAAKRHAAALGCQ